MIKSHSIYRILFWLTLFSIAMGYLETSVVVYLRALYYPDGFQFPLVAVPPDIAITEFWREVATIIMLVGAGIMAGKNPAQRFVLFLYCFAIWDIFYYVFLYVLLGWPVSLFTWDILFLVPVPWVGPVICPCLVALTMIVFALITVHWQEKGKNAKLSGMEIGILIMGCAVVLVSFMWDYFTYVKLHGNGMSVWSLSNDKDLFSEAPDYIPNVFNWTMFWCGQIVLIGGVFLFGMRMKKN
ncbi:MAG TPA: hypothetical protein VK826_00345 [Bacteroidia bacterium]|nr:hypothetical protein [Bacteroidia bacterium]